MKKITRSGTVICTFLFCVSKRKRLYIWDSCIRIDREQGKGTVTCKRRIYIMAYVITDECVSCGACAAQCPVEAITEGDDKYVIDQDTCVECGACAAQCPVEAIVEE